MVNPLAPAYNLFLGLLNALPPPILLAILLGAGLFVIASIIRIIFFH